MTNFPNLETAKERYFRLVCERLGAWPDPKGKLYIPCPSCGKGDKHFVIDRRGAFCFRCGYKPLFRELLDVLGGNIPAQVQIAPARSKVPAWKKWALELAEGLTQTPGLVQKWQAYKPLPETVIRERLLGYGVFPNLWHSKGEGEPDWIDPEGGRHWKCEHPRLIVPLLCESRVVGFRCRATECRCPRWLSPSGSKLVLYNGGRLGTPSLASRIGDTQGCLDGDTLWILENPIDALLVETYWHIPAVATLGVSIWSRFWTQTLANRRAVVAYDHDASGIMTGPIVEADWKINHRGLRMPMRGNKLCRELGRAKLYSWEDSDPIGLDIGDLFMRNPSQTLKLAQWFVREILRRDWTTEDFRGPHMKHASDLLKRYSVNDICACLEANRDGVIGDGYDLKFMKAIEASGEPNLIAQWLAYKANKDGEIVPVYLDSAYADWQARKDRVYAEVQADPQEAPVEKPKKPRHSKTEPLEQGSLFE